jgi:preprotein translocase subunit SecA
VQALTANDYLVQRDAQAMAPLYTALGLRCAAVQPGQDDAARQAAWAADVAYATGHELVFDHLRDGLAGCGAAAHPLQEHARRLQGLPEPATARLRGLGLVLLDEADSLLLDEALMPLVLSQNLRDPQRQALLWRAIRQARTLAAGRWRCASPTPAVPSWTATAAPGPAAASATNGWPAPSPRCTACSASVTTWCATARCT